MIASYVVFFNSYIVSTMNTDIELAPATSNFTIEDEEQEVEDDDSSEIRQQFDSSLQRQRYRRWFEGLAHIFGFIVLLSTYTLLITVSSDGKGNYNFFFTTVTLSGELLKLFMSLLLYAVTYRNSFTPLRLSVSKSLHFSLPAILYCINNNLLFLILLVIDPATFQVLSNINIVFVALFTVLLIKVNLDLVHWISMIILFVGSSLTQMQCENTFSHSKIISLLLITLYGAIDALGSVYTERRLKKDAEDSIHVQNVHIFFYGSLANLILFFIHDFRHVQKRGLFYGYDWFTVIIIISFALVGIFSNFIMKQQSNITRSFCVSISMLLTTFMAYMFLDFHVTLLFAASLIIVICSVLLYRHRNIFSIRSHYNYKKLEERSARIVTDSSEQPIVTAVLDYDPEALREQASDKEN